MLVKPGSYTVRLWRLIHNAYSSSYFIESEAWLQRACRSLLSSSAAEDWQRINPFLSKTEAPFLTANQMAFRDSESVKIVLFHCENGIRHFLGFKFASETLFPEK